MRSVRGAPLGSTRHSPSLRQLHPLLTRSLTLSRASLWRGAERQQQQAAGCVSEQEESSTRAEGWGLEGGAGGGGGALGSLCRATWRPAVCHRWRAGALLFIMFISRLSTPLRLFSSGRCTLGLRKICYPGDEAACFWCSDVLHMSYCLSNLMIDVVQ